MIWLLQYSIFGAVLASNFYWEWFPNQTGAAAIGVFLAAIATGAVHKYRASRRQSSGRNQHGELDQGGVSGANDRPAEPEDWGFFSSRASAKRRPR
jgi:hypothetical protein